MKLWFPRFPLLLVAMFSAFQGFAVETERHYLSGTDPENTVEWGFEISGGRRAGEQTTIPVPSNWEMQGFGSFHYSKDWGNEETDDKEAIYTTEFEAPSEWQGKVVRIVFGGVMTDATVWINGKQAGLTHQGGFYQFDYEISQLLNYGALNALKVQVQKFSSNLSVNKAERDADYWLFGGIYRPVWLEILPQTHISHFAVDAQADGNLAVQLEISGRGAASAVRVTVTERNSERIVASEEHELLHKSGTSLIRMNVDGAQPWSAESPMLYKLELTIWGDDGESALHTVKEDIGFRTIEVRAKDGIYVNGTKIRLKGSNRHSFWPTTGRATTAAQSRADILLMKEMNMNAVRMAHYPPDKHFLEAADELGIYIINELAGWQAAYDTEVGEKLVRELVRRDVNHPSIIIWANGNEGGWNSELDDDFAIHDPQRRPVIKPWANFGGVNTSHYESYHSGGGLIFDGDDIILPTEFLHGLYDGGAGAGLDDWWKRMVGHPLGAGGFIWAFVDEAVYRDDIQAHDGEGNRAPDGILGPYREKEGSFYAIKEIWAPLYIPLTERDRLPPTFDGKVHIENRYDELNLDTVTFAWKLKRLEEGSVLVLHDEGSVLGPSVAPWHLGTLDLQLPQDWCDSDLLELAAFNREGEEIYTWNWMLTNASEVAERKVVEGQGGIAIERSGGDLLVSAGASVFTFDGTTGFLKSSARGNTIYPLANGPVFVEAGELEFRIVAEEQTDVFTLTARSLDERCEFSWTIFSSGWLKLDYELRRSNQYEVPYFGISFDYDESMVTGVRYLGKGPYRVWKNRRKGVEYGVWEKGYNDTMTGVSWNYPEFKGYHEDLYWATLQSESTPVTVVSGTNDIYLRLFTPESAPNPVKAVYEFPEGDISFLHAVSPIGSKFHEPSAHGPQGVINRLPHMRHTFSATLYFYLEPAQ